MECKKHPKYTASRKPSRTKKYPRGCPQCWKVWHYYNDAIDFMAPWDKVGEGTYDGKPYELYTCNYGKTYDFE